MVQFFGIELEKRQALNYLTMKATFANYKEEETVSASAAAVEKSELMQLFESEVHNPYRGQMDLINAILSSE